MCYFILHFLGDFCNSGVKEYSVIIGQALDNFCVSRKKSQCFMGEAALLFFCSTKCENK